MSVSSSIERLSAEDQLMRRWNDRWRQNIGALAILEGSALLGPGAQFRLDAARRRIAERLHLLPRFRQVIHTPRRGLGGPLWIDAYAGAFNLGIVADRDAYPDLADFVSSSSHGQRRERAAHAFPEASP